MNTLAYVPRNKKLAKRYVDNVAEILRPIVRDRFDGNATAFAKALGVSQPQLAQILKQGGGDRGIGIVVLMAIRDYLQDRTLDEILGLDPPEVVRMSAIESTLERVLEKRFFPPAQELPIRPPPDPHRPRRARGG